MVKQKKTGRQNPIPFKTSIASGDKKALLYETLRRFETQGGP
jgi:hypothetical protein